MCNNRAALDQFYGQIRVGLEEEEAKLDSELQRQAMLGQQLAAAVVNMPAANDAT